MKHWNPCLWVGWTGLTVVIATGSDAWFFVVPAFIAFLGIAIAALFTTFGPRATT